jgi:hypothetical protein
MTDQALQAIKLTSEHDKELLNLVRQWFETRKVDLDDPEPCYALVSRLLKSFRTETYVDSTTDVQARSGQPPKNGSATTKTKRVTSVSLTVQNGVDKANMVVNGGDPQQLTETSTNQEDPPTKRGAKTDESRRECPSDDENDDNLLWLVNDLARYLSLFPCPLVVDENEEEGESKLTVADIARQLIVYFAEEPGNTDDLYLSVLLHDVEIKPTVSSFGDYQAHGYSVKQLRAQFYGTENPPIKNDAYVSPTTPVVPNVHHGFRTFVMKALQSLHHTAASSVEAFHDFEYLWASCEKREQFKNSITNLLSSCTSNLNNSNGKRPREDGFVVLSQDECKACAWKISCLLSQQDHLNEIQKSEHHDEKADKHGVSRRQRLLTSAAVMGLLSVLNPVNMDAIKNVDIAISKDENGKPVPIGAHESLHEEGAVGATVNKSDVAKKARITSSEDDAITALSMIFSAPKPSDALESSQDRDAVDVIVDAANALHSFFTVTNRQLEIGQPFGRIEVEEKISCIAKSNSIVSCGDWHKIARELPSYDSSIHLDDKTQKLLGQFTSMNLLDEALDKQHKKKNSNHCDVSLGERLVAMVDDVAFALEPAFLEYVCFASKKYKSSTDQSDRSVCFILVFDPDDPRVSMSTETQVAEAITALKAARSPEAATQGPSNGHGVEFMQLNEWCVAILSANEIKPSQRLMLYLEASDDEMVKQSKAHSLISGIHETRESLGWRAKIVTALNRAMYKLTDEDTIDSPEGNEKLVVDPRTGELTFDPIHKSNPDLQLCIALVTLYYHALECTIFQETARKKTASHPKIVQNDSFHRALLSFCYVCLLKGFSVSGKLRLEDRHQGLELYHILQMLESTPYSYLKASEAVGLALRFDKFRPKTALPFTASLPKILQRHISLCEIIIVDSHIWSRDENLTLEGCLMDAIQEIKLLPKPESDVTGVTWPPESLKPTLPEEKDDYFDPNKGKKAPKLKTAPRPKVVIDPEHQFTAYVIRKLLKIMHFRIDGLCNALHIPKSYPIAGQIWIAFRYLVRHHVELLYDRHVDQLLLCVLYGVCKIMRFEPELSFSTIIDGYTEIRSREIGDRGCQRVVRQIRIVREGGIDQAPDGKQQKGRGFGNVIHLYNQAFVPAMKNHLLQSKSLKKASLKLRRLLAEKRSAEAFQTAKGNAVHVAPSPASKARVRLLPLPPAIPPPPLPFAIPVQKGNVTLNIRLVSTPGEALLARVGGQPRFTGDTLADDPNVAFVTVTSPTAAKVKTRAFFAFGDTSKEDIERANRMVTKWTA